MSINYVCCFLVAILNISDGYNQDDYKVRMDRMEVISYNRKYIRDLKAGLVLFNRTQRVINGSVTLTMDISTDVAAEVQFYKFTSNEYRFFPITLSVKICEEIEKNTLDVKEFLKQHSDISGCPIKKGYHYVRNAIPDFSKFPPYMVRGDYKITGKVFLKKELLGEVVGYASVMAVAMFPK